jgi:hypothetical protein
MIGFLEGLGQIAQQIAPEVQRYTMYEQGIDPRIVEPQIERMVAGQQERQAAEAEMQRKQSLAQQIMERGANLTPQEIMAIGAQDAELGKLAAKVFLDGQKQQTMQPVTLPDGSVMGYDKYTNTMTPAGMAGQGAVMGGGGYQTSFEMPVDDMMQVSLKGQREIESNRIKADAPLTQYQIRQLDAQRQKNAQARQDKELDRMLSPNEGQSKSYGFLERMAQAEQNMSKLPLEPFVSRTQSALSALPFGNSFVSEDYQQAKQAETDFITAVLRKESGAAIGEQEYERERGKYFPVAGDSLEVIKQKAESRSAAMRGMAKGAGALAKDFALPKATTFETQAETIPEDVTPDLWGAMTPEERALWQR